MTRRARGAGAVFQRADGRWEAQLRIGPSRRRSLYAPTRPDVIAKLEKARWSMALGLPVRMPVTRTLADFLSDWLEVTKGRVRYSTFRNYDFNVRRINSELGTIPLCRLTAPTIQDAYGRLHLEGVGDAGIHQLHRTLHRALGQAFKWGLIPQNPTALVLPPRRPRRQMSALTAEELSRLLDSAQDDRLHALWVLLGTTGMRLGEALGLGWVRRPTERAPAVRHTWVAAASWRRLRLRRAEDGRQPADGDAQPARGRGAPPTPSSSARRAGVG